MAQLIDDGLGRGGTEELVASLERASDGSVPLEFARFVDDVLPVDRVGRTLDEAMNIVEPQKARACTAVLQHRVRTQIQNACERGELERGRTR